MSSFGFCESSFRVMDSLSSLVLGGVSLEPKIKSMMGIIYIEWSLLGDASFNRNWLFEY